MPPSFFGTLAAATLLAIGIANGWAFNSVRRATSTWARDAFIAQVFVLFLAGYVAVTDLRSPQINWRVMVIAALVLAVAFLWLVFLVPKSALEWTKTALIVTALFPLAGLLQFWLQNYYIPSTSMPLVDISSDLSPQGRTGPIIHLSAKVTIHNRGTSQVNVANSLMRVTAYPSRISDEAKVYANACSSTADRSENWCRLANGFDPSGIERDVDFRVNPNRPDVITPTPPTDSQPIYAGVLQSLEFLIPGETDVYQREVDIDSREVQLAHLTVSATFLTARRMQDIRSCVGEHALIYEGFPQFAAEVRQVQTLVPGNPRQGHYFCREYDIAPGNFVEKLIAGHPAIQVSTWLNSPDHLGTEYPLITADFGTAGKFDQPDPHQQLERKLEQAYPASVVTSQSEYAPTENPSPTPTPPGG